MPGWQNLIVCDGPNCTWESLIALINAAVTDLILISTLLVVVAFVIGGLKLMTSQGNPAALTEVRKMMWKIVLGYVWILAAWLVVYTITSVLLKPGFSLLTKPTGN